MFNKKGMSEVVSNVLIVLVVIGAVALIAGVVINIVQTGTQNTGEIGQCLAINVAVTSCAIADASGAVTATVRRGTGGGATSVNYRIVSTNADLTTYSNVANAGLSELETFTTTTELGSVGGTCSDAAGNADKATCEGLVSPGVWTWDSASVNIVVVKGNGELCPLISAERNCVVV